MNERFEHAPVGMLDVRPDGEIETANAAATDLLDADPAIDGQPVSEIFPSSIDDVVPRAFDDGGPDPAQTREYYPALDRWVEVTIRPAGDIATVYLQDVTDQKNDEQTIAALRSDLNRLTIINELISDILAELVDASSREEIAETICERLGETDIYEFAWIGERKLGGEDIVVRAGAGSTGRTLDRIGESLDGPGTTPEERVVETGTPTLVQPLGEDQSVPEPVRRAAFADGLQSLLAIPLTYGSSVHGVVGIYSADQGAFSERERASFVTLGEMAGFAINASRNQSLLLSDSVVELTIEITDPGTPLFGAAATADATVSVEGVVPGGDDRVIAYLLVEEADPTGVADVLEERGQVLSSRVIGDHGETGSIEATLSEETPLGQLSSQGVTITAAEFGDHAGRVVVELPPEENVRRLAEAVTREFDAEVVAKRERDRSIRTTEEFRDELGERLTDRQENALRTAFFADYFESPRGSTAQEVAAALDITGPTLLHHLRAGQRKLLSEFFETTDRS